MLHQRPWGSGWHWAFAAVASIVGTSAALLAPSASARFVPNLPRLGLADRLGLPAANAAPAAPAAPALPRLIGPVSPELRAKGYNDCFLPDPGPGAYLPYRPGPVGGRLFLPKEGGHTDDFGYDVLVHFHGAEPVRKTLVQVSEGLVYLGIDLGIASGPYEKAYENPQTFAYLRAGVEKTLRAHAGDERAHIRHLGLSAWSAGYGAVNAVLRHHAASVDAVVLLDGLHADFSPENKPRTSLDSLTATHLAPTFAFAQAALRGEKIFFFSHSHIDPVDYASTARTGELLLAMLGLEKTPVPDAAAAHPFGLRAFVDEKGFHLRDYGGHNEHAHCAHTRFVEEPLVDLLAPAWQTPRAARADEPPAEPAPPG
ncbi:MAG TPA: hypothetical protein VFS43_25070 [Polyangiaceae bacterium]|nr:hypothetical protein [Polyangiaceae bacterium]